VPLQLLPNQLTTFKGFGLESALALRDDAVVFASTRDPQAAAQLLELKKTRKNLHVVKLTSGDEADNVAAAAEIKSKAGALHVVIANAGTG
jgi:NAD(P)-dependent dehydrogenase (short-subunit alcohol dehydrogenase family)